MNNFIFDEMVAEEYRQDRMAEAEEHNRVARSPENIVIVSVYRGLAKTGALLETWGARMKTRYDCLAHPEQCEMLANPAK